MLNVEIEKVSNRARRRARPNFLQTSRSRTGRVMRKATAKAKKRKSRSKAARGSRKPLAFETVRKRINNLVGNQAVGLVKSAIAEADQGHFPAMKYLFEMIGLYPATVQEAMPGEESLAKTLLERLGLPEDPLAERAEGNNSPAEATARAADAVK